jgi:multimeric flavodoxin WrbA
MELVLMNVIGINGGPRKKWNTAMMLEKALEGAASKGARTSLIHLYDLNFKGCISCFACKKRNGKSYGKCAVEDDLTSVYAMVKGADALILGSPVYFSDVSGEMRSFMERLLFPYLVYAIPRETLFPKKIRTGLIYTMNASAESAKQIGYDRLFATNENVMKMIFGHCESLMSYETYQFKNYSKMVADMFDVEKRRKRREEIFPRDCQKAYEMGAGFAEKQS